MLNPKEVSYWMRFLRAIRSLKLEDCTAAVAAGGMSWGCDLLGIGIIATGGLGLGVGGIVRIATKTCRTAYNRRKRLRLSRARQKAELAGASSKALPKARVLASDDGPPAR